MSLQQTTSQTVGPYFAIGLTWLNRDDLVAANAPGKITIEGSILDADQKAVPDAVIEVWQANTHGKYAHPDDTQEKPLDPAFRGYGRIPADALGRFQFTTVKPGRVAGPDGKDQAPHINLSIFMRGLMRRLITRIYFEGDAANDEDYILGLVAAARRHTLMAKPDSADPNLLRFDIRLQGANETVFFDL